MEFIKLISLTEDEAIYEYYPEDNRNAPGIVKLMRKTGERIFVKASEDDFANMYAAHAVKRLEKYNRANEFQEEDLVAWG